MSRIKGAIAITVVALSLSGCGQYKALPNEQRYQFINEVKKSVDLPSAGEIISESYDNGDGVFSPSIYSAEVKGENIYPILYDRIKNNPEITDCSGPRTGAAAQLHCRKGQVYISLSKFEDEPKIFFKLTDSSSGR